MQTYKREFLHTTTGSNEVVTLDYPGQCIITSITVLKVGTGAVDHTFYNRRLTGAVVNIQRIRNDGNGKCEIITTAFHGAKVGDVVTVASSPHSGYNTAHRVTGIKVGDDLRLVTDQTFSVVAYGGTVQLTIPSAEQVMYKVVQVAGAGPVTVANELPFRNEDPLPNSNTGIERRIYASVAIAGTYRVSITSKLMLGGAY